MNAARFQSGDMVAVYAAYPPGHVRTPYFIRGKFGVVDSIVGAYPNPEELAYGRDGLPALPLYRVRFKQTDVWPDYAGPVNDTVMIDLYESWLEPTS